MPGTDLYLKWSSTDNGARPLVPCGLPNAYWTNQSIWLSDPSSGALKNVATENETIRINAVVTNRSTTRTFPATNGATDKWVGVQFWVCNFALAVGPAGAIPSFSPPSGTVFSFFVPFPPSSTLVGWADWTPATGDLTINTTAAGEGHVCIAANCFAEGMPDGEGGDMSLPFATLDPCGDGPTTQGGHHGQHNILVAPHPHKKDPVHLPFNVINPGRKNAAFRIEVQELVGAAVLGDSEREALLAERWVDLVGGKDGPVRVRKVGGQPIEPLERARLRQGGHLVLSGSGRRIEASRRPVAKARLLADDGNA